MISETDALHARLLIVEDQHASNPADLCGLPLRNPYDPMLLDPLMPGMDGFDQSFGEAVAIVR